MNEHYIHALTDGSSGPDGAGCGWTIKGTADYSDDVQTKWCTLVEAHFEVPGSCNALQTELLAVLSLFSFWRSIITYNTSNLLNSARPSVWMALVRLLQLW